MGRRKREPLFQVTHGELLASLAAEEAFYRITEEELIQARVAAMEYVPCEDGTSAHLRVRTSWNKKLRVYTRVDFVDLRRLSAYVWYGARRCKKIRVYARVKDNGLCQMSRFIMGVTDPTIHVHHVDGDTLDHRHSQLEVCSIAEHRMRHKKGVARKRVAS